jgi:D-glycero-D-manno-heptose 1,7-bisphosphate phosphatase
VELLPGVGATLSILARRGCRLFLVSNQSGVGRGFFCTKDVLACNAALAERLADFGVMLEDSVFCPHAPEDQCLCRKPAVGLWNMLQERHGLRAASAVMVGDKAEDMAFAARAGLAGRILTLADNDGKTLAGSVNNSVKGGGLAETPALRRLIPEREEQPDILLPNFSWLPEALQLLEISPDGAARPRNNWG